MQNLYCQILTNTLHIPFFPLKTGNDYLLVIKFFQGFLCDDIRRQLIEFLLRKTFWFTFSTTLATILLLLLQLLCQLMLYMMVMMVMMMVLTGFQIFTGMWISHSEKRWYKSMVLLWWWYNWHTSQWWRWRGMTVVLVVLVMPPWCCSRRWGCCVSNIMKVIQVTLQLLSYYLVMES